MSMDYLWTEMDPSEKKEQTRKDPKIFRGGIAFLRIITNKYLGGS